MREGLKALGIDAGITSSRARESDIAILLGTTMWRDVERTGRFLLVDRCSFGDTSSWVSLVWDGHGRRGDHCVPADLGNRWERLRFPVHQWVIGSRVVLCGQTETYSPHWARVEDWYATVPATHFRKHPAGVNPTALPETRDWRDCRLAVTLNSSVAVDAVIQGVPTVTQDEGSMAWDVTAHDMSVHTPDREPWLRWLAWTQWHHDEIQAGHPIKHLFEGL
jgi:hypothetical protein